MIIVKLDGGMGNQLFQYALGKYLAVKLNAELKLDTGIYTQSNKRRYALHHFAIGETFCTDKEKRALKRKEYLSNQLRKIGFAIQPYWYTEPSPGYHDRIQQFTDNVYLEGFWQSEKYFKPAENILRKELIIQTAPSWVNSQLLETIQSVNAVSVHVRRGDYVSDEVTNAVHGACDISYYDEAVRQMTAGLTAPHFFVFSDDMEWTKANLSVSGFAVTYVDHNAAADYEDLRLIYSCKHHIIANSSFSWWGAWLNNYSGKKVIAPKQWFRSILTNNDIIPEGWLTL